MALAHKDIRNLGTWLGPVTVARTEGLEVAKRIAGTRYDSEAIRNADISRAMRDDTVSATEEEQWLHEASSQRKHNPRGTGEPSATRWMDGRMRIELKQHGCRRRPIPIKCAVLKTGQLRLIKRTVLIYSIEDADRYTYLLWA